MSSRKDLQCWLLPPSVIADAARSGEAEAITPLPLETPSYMTHRAGATFPTTADVYNYSHSGLPVTVGDIKPVLEPFAPAPILRAGRLVRFHSAARDPKHPIYSHEGCGGKHARGGSRRAAMHIIAARGVVGSEFSWSFFVSSYISLLFDAVAGLSIRWLLIFATRTVEFAPVVID